MTRSRFVSNATRTLPLSDGDWIVVKDRLNVGEVRAEFARRYEYPEGGGPPRLNLQQLGFSQVVAYLLDWSLPEMPIRGLAPADLDRVLRNLDADDFAEIQTAIDDHVLAMDEARAAQKKTATGAPPSPPTSRSPDAAAGGTSGSPNSTLMSISSS
jgi:hypothetical protein